MRGLSAYVGLILLVACLATFALAACGGGEQKLASTSVPTATAVATVAAATPAVTSVVTITSPTSTAPSGTSVYIAPGTTIPPGRTPPPIGAAKGVLASSGDGKVIQIAAITNATFLPNGQTLTFTITDQTLLTQRKPNQTVQVTTLAAAGIKNGDPVSFIYETYKNADGTYHLRSIRYDE